MTRTITIDPVTRIEGHSKITVQLDAAGRVEGARFHVNEFRGFEKFCEGRLMWEMPGITSRICGICPASHLVASAKAGDEILQVTIPETAEKLRRLITLGQWVQSHALSFFHLSSPDLLLGFDADPATRNIFGVMAADREFARRGIRLRKFGQEVIELLGGRKIHTPWAVAGGVREPFDAGRRDHLLGWIPEVLETVQLALAMLGRAREQFADEIPSFGEQPTLYLGLVAPDGALEYYGGALRIRDATGGTVADQLPPREYREHFGEVTESWSYLKFPYYRPAGLAGGVYRVGPLARLNVCDYIPTPRADAERLRFRALAGGRPVHNPFHYHYARLIEILFAIEQIERLLHDPAILGTHVRAQAMVNASEGVGCCEAPRGVLFHHYTVDGNGVLQRVNMLIATAQNNLAMNATVLALAKRYLDGATITEGLLNRLEAGIRAYDPCLSCSTHAIGQMPLTVQVFGADGGLLSERGR
ncbi:MAG: Ni/Fe hydrogenase subunit alpha [Gemmatimonadetes bacterium]|nr:Ni/Fe hydrogenase subunit alpha [Gemmatimonadota bacterium]